MQDLLVNGIQSTSEHASCEAKSDKTILPAEPNVDSHNKLMLAGGVGLTLSLALVAVLKTSSKLDGIDPQGQQGQQGGWMGNNEAAMGAVTAGLAGAMGGGMQNQFAAQAGINMGATALQQGRDAVKSNLEKYISLNAARSYFKVDNKYVLDKLLLVIAFPVLLLGFKGSIKWQFPHRFARTENGALEDLHSPDLYIPSMAFVTYVILNAFAMGTRGVFNPEVLGSTASYGMVAMAVELFLVRVGSALFNGPTLVNMDIASYSGYKFVGLSALVVVHETLGSWSTVLYYVFFFYLACSYGFFLVKSLEYIMGANDEMGSTKEDKVKLLRLVMGALQLPMFFFLSPGF